MGYDAVERRQVLVGLPPFVGVFLIGTLGSLRSAKASKNPSRLKLQKDWLLPCCALHGLCIRFHRT
jgi:hypothetical protein